VAVILCFLATIIYFSFPELVITVFYGSAYLDVSHYLVYSAIALSFLSLSNIVLLYGLSTNSLKKPGYLLIFLAIELILLISFRQSILSYILAFMVSNIVMFIGTLFFVKK
jgi:O-antigen/teichoic acid export membrane protein